MSELNSIASALFMNCCTAIVRRVSEMVAEIGTSRSALARPLSNRICGFVVGDCTQYCRFAHAARQKLEGRL